MEWTTLEVNDQLDDLYHYALRHRHGHYRVLFRGLNIHCIDLLSFFVAAKDIFIQGIYDVTTPHEQPLFIDGGAHIGLFSLRAVQLYPKARILAFEPDSEALTLFQLNMAANGVSNVELVPAGLHNVDGVLKFCSRGDDGNTLFGDDANTTVRVTRLSRHLHGPVDFLKLNIEGSEWPVIEECGELLRNVQQLVLEYHGFPELGDRLHLILNALHHHGFRYMVHDFDKLTNPASKPPFHIQALTRYFLLVAARNMGGAHGDC